MNLSTACTTQPERQPVALITGASAGLGLAFAEALAARGMALLLVARRGEVLQVHAEALRQRHARPVWCLPLDLSQAEAPAQLDEFCRQQQLHVQWLINNAGAGGPGFLDGSEWAQQAAFLQLMMLTPAELCWRFLPAMQARGFGRIINVASVAAFIARSGSAHYGPSKAYLVALSEALHLQGRHQGVHVCALCPGFVHSEFHDHGALRQMKSALPRWLWYDAPTVVAEGLAAAERGHSVYVSGRLYRWVAPLLRPPFIRRWFCR